MVRPEWVAARRAFEREERPDGYRTLTEVGLDGSWVTPIQMTSDSPCGVSIRQGPQGMSV